MPLNALRVFDAVYRHGTFYGAARELSVTPSAVSHQMRHLEEWLGTSLFGRRGKRLEFDANAVLLAGALRLAFSDIERVCDEIRKRNNNWQLTIAVIPSVAVCWLIPRLSLFRDLQTKIDLKIMYAIFGHEINYEDVDIAIIYSKERPIVPRMETIPFLPGAIAPVCSKSFFESRPGLNNAEEIAKCNLLHDTNTAGWHAWLGEAYSTIKTSLADIVFEDFNLLRAAVLAGQGIALCPMAIIQDDLDAGRLVKLSTRTVNHEYNYFILRRAAKENEPVSIFYHWLIGMTIET
ncbi:MULTISPECIES: LysR substrate-binding domain-containing protein [Acidiphilium]|uniref:LysR substrate-binding domain-containing protein n=1 Tax=Acidiphilium TaxID=522 RepID=UPI0009E7871D|nr:MULTISPECIES: LysR substrate-binding domain-containing protein [Acidiphilium]